MDLQHCVEELCRSVGAHSVPEPDSGGRFALEFDKGLAFSLYAIAGQMVMEATVLKLPAALREADAICRRLMQVNLAVAQKQAEELAVDAASMEIRLYRRLSASPSPQEFLAAAESFLNRLEFWLVTATRPQSATARSPFSLFRS